MHGFDVTARAETLAGSTPLVRTCLSKRYLLQEQSFAVQGQEATDQAFRRTASAETPG